MLECSGTWVILPYDSPYITSTNVLVTCNRLAFAVSPRLGTMPPIHSHNIGRYIDPRLVSLVIDNVGSAVHRTGYEVPGSSIAAPRASLPPLSSLVTMVTMPVVCNVNNGGNVVNVDGL